ncbi:MAG: hypothetical protein ABIR38_06690 [Chthoniobacterales bacterium]
MNTKRTILVAAALWLATAVASIAGSAQLGTWKLNEAKSKLGSDGAKNTTVTYTEAKGDMMEVIVDGVDKDGKPIHWTWKGKFDGEQHKTKGSSMADTIGYKMVDDHTNEMTVMKDGKVVMTGTIAVNKDGKSRVVTIKSTDADGKEQTVKAVYDKE